MPFSAVTITIILMTSAVAVAGSSSESVDAKIRKFMSHGNVPGLFAAVVRDDTVIYQNACGVARLEESIPLTPETCMELGSVSKVFAAEVIYSLIGKGILNAGDPVTKFLDGAHESWSDITVSHLLSHTSGIQNYLLDPRFNAADYLTGGNAESEEFFNTVPVDSMVRMFYSLPVEFTPGTGWSYSNTGYILLGKIAENVTGRKFFDLAEEILTAPLKMANTMANDSAERKGCLAKGYFNCADGLRPAHILTGNYAFSAGTWATTGSDMIRFLMAIHKRELPSDRSGYDWRHLAINTQLPFTYEGGRFHSTFHGKRIISHNGGTPGFSSSWIYDVGKNTCVIVLINKQDYSPMDRLAWNLLAEFEPELAYPHKLITGEEEIRQSRLAMSIVDRLRDNEELPEAVAGPLKIFMESENGRGLWQWFFAGGSPGTIYCVDSEITGALKAYRFLQPHSKDVEYRITILLDRDDRVVQMLPW